MGKKDDVAELANAVEDLLADIGEDRARLNGFLDKLLHEYEDSENIAGIAEYVAKLVDSGTKQLQVRAVLVKTLVKRVDGTDDTSEEDELADAIGMPFTEETEDGAN